MLSEVVDEIEENLTTLSEEERDWNFCRALDAHYLDGNIPCMFCDFDIYARSYERFNTELMFGGYE